MTKKTFVRARLVKGPKWLIDYTIFLPSGEESRHRQDFFLNEIDDLVLRERIGLHLIRCLEVIVQGQGAPARRSPAVTLRDGLSEAILSKQGLRKNTLRGYERTARKFSTWAQKSGWLDRPLREFTKRPAREFFANLSAGGLSGRTINNYKSDLHALWQEMENSELCTLNPWAIRSVRVGEKGRRTFTDQERRAVAAEIEKTDYWLFRALLLQFFCFIRPDEINKLRFRDFDFGKGTVRVGFAESKVWRTRFATIPREVLPYFVDGRFDRQPGNFFMLPGKNDNPGPNPVEKTRAYKRHRKVLERLLDRGELQNIAGLTWYSWKDTGISLHARRTSPLSTRDQAGHRNFNTTLIYYHSEDVNAEYAAIPNDLYL